MRFERRLLLLIAVVVALALQHSGSAHAQVVLPAIPLAEAPVSFVAPVVASPAAGEPKAAPWWATTLAVAGPLADGLSTVYAIGQSGPQARVMEGNAFYHRLFGSDVKAGEIMAFKVAQAALMGAVVHHAGKRNRAGAISVAVLTAGVNFAVSALNVRVARHAQRLNAGQR